jgi:hypothetical protein
MVNRDIPPLGFQSFDSFSFPKTGNMEENEDTYGFRTNEQEECWLVAVSDGATAKNDFSHLGLSGGAWAADFVTEACLDANKYGVELVGVVSEAVRQDYDRINVDGVVGFAGATLLDARFVRADDSWELVITQVGDSGFRLQRHEGEPIIEFNRKAIDEINGQARSDYIQARLADLKHEPDEHELQDILAEGRSVIENNLNRQYHLQNESGLYLPDGRPLGYGVIDGKAVPEEFIKITREPAENVKSLELFTDGYTILPEEPSIAAYEETWRLQQKRDPYALGSETYNYPPSTKIGDDRTVVILSNMSS